MDELRLYRTFVHVVECGSISAAARRLNTSISSVARQLSYLEAALGVTLLNRTTRRQSLTEVGRLYQVKIVALVREFDDLKREASTYQDAVKGCLRVHLRTSAGNQVVIPALPRFFASYPELTIDLSLTDERADLVAAGIDVAVWLGHLDDSSIIARRLCPSRRVVCASPDYLARNAPPKGPLDLKDHNCLVYRAKNYDDRWRFSKGGKTIEVGVVGALQADGGAALLTAAINGLGLVTLQEWMVRDAISKGELVPVLTDYEVSPTEFDTALYAVYPQSRRISPKARVFIDFLVTLFRS
jgi:DNA-binding transcriptional LysR family regulator